MARILTLRPRFSALLPRAPFAVGRPARQLLALAGALLSLTAQAQVTVTSRQPARNATAVARTAAVTVGFSQAISAASAPNLRVYGSQLRGRRPGAVAGGGTASLTFTPGQAFAPGEVLSVSLPAALTSTSGSSVARQVYQFTAATGGAGRGFFGDTAVVGVTGNRDQALGDLDNDGDLDLVTAGGLYGCRIYLNNGAGRYTFKNGVIAAQTPSGVALADVDGDGDLDLLVGDADNAYVCVCINDGTGEFIGSVTGAQNAPVGPKPVGVATGDVDGDGDLDFVTANNTGNSATVRFNNGALPLLYTSAITVTMGAGPTAVALADIDNDGDLDLLTTNAGTSANPQGTVSVSRNSGTGAFGAYTSVAVGLQPTELALADVDGDGDLDLLTANAGGASVSLRTNNGSGTFGGTTALALPAGSMPSGLRTGDLDGDGDLDLLVAQGLGGRVLTYLNTAGTFAVQARPLRLSQGLTPPATAVGVVLGDVDGDLDLDLITSDGNGQVLLSLNLSTVPPLPAPAITSLTPTAGPVGSTVTIAGTALAEVISVQFNGVPAPSFVLNGAGTGLSVTVPAGATTGLVTVTTEEAGTASSPGPFTVTQPVPVLVTGVTPPRNTVAVPRSSNLTATFAAAITAASAGNVRVFGNLRQGRRTGTVAGGGTTTLTFDPAQDFAPGERVSMSLPGTLLAADGNQVAPQVAQFTAAAGGTGQMNFNTATTLTITRPGEPVLGDIDNDGDLDLLVAPDYYNGTVSVRLNNGSGTLTPAPDLATGANGVRSVVLGDVDADGDLDLVVVPMYADVSVWKNDGTGAFSSAGTAPVSADTRQAVLGDVDGDGDLDLVLMTSQQVLVRLNNGAGAFSGSYAFTLDFSRGSASPNHLALGDVDNDGDLDLVVAGTSGVYAQHPVRVELNNGAGQFAGAQEMIFPSSVTRAMLGDLDNDGDLDLAVQSTVSYAQKMSIRLNDGSGAFAGGGELLLYGAGGTFADLDADGDLDLVTHAGVGVNNGIGGFATILPIIPYAYSPAGIALGDLDGDLDLDLVTSQESDAVAIRLNQPSPAPTVTALTPGSGPVGSSVLLSGTNLVGARTVAFNGVPALSFAVNSRTELVATVPVGASTGPITVVTPAGTATSAPFTVTLPIAVLGVSPARSAASAPPGTAVAATFAQAISSASASGVRVHGDRLRGRRPGTVAGGGTSTLTFAPAQPFAAGETVTVTLPATLAGTSGGNVVRHVHQFTAAATGTGTGLFQATGAADVNTGNRLSDVAVGDLDNDGDLDLLASNGSIQLNNGTGNFSSGSSVYLNYPYNLTLADVDGNGSLDVLDTSGDVLLNNGNATFTAAPNFTPLTYSTRDVATGDFDGDGDLDVAYPKDNADTLFIRFNNGSGVFSGLQRVAVGSAPAGVAVGDVDNDGDLDMVVVCGGVSSAAGVLSICLNNGNGLFVRGSQLPATTGPMNGFYTTPRVVLGDLDGDGDLDLATNSGLLRFNDGRGVFSGTQAVPLGYALVLGDVDSDGDLDLLLTSSSVAHSVRLNNGLGQFSPAPVGFSFSGDTSDGLALADLDNDGDLDVVASGYFNNLVHVRLNQRLAPPTALAFAPASGLPGAPIIFSGVDLIGVTQVTFNGTAAAGFVVNSATQITVNVPAGATSGPVSATNPLGTATSAASFTVLQPVNALTLSPARNATAPLTASVAVTFSQPVAVNSPATLAVFSAKRGGRLAGARTGAGTATMALAPAQPFRPGEVLSVSLPAYTAGNQSRVVKQVYQFRAAVGGTGRGYLAAPVSTALGAPSLGAVLGDVNGDGTEDVLLHTTAAVQVKFNDGAANFSSGGSVPVAQSTGPTLALGDLDGDGDLDLAVASRSNGVVSIRLNNGAGAFSGTLEVAVGQRPSSMVLADLDADGDLDLVTGNQDATACTTSVRFNDGAGNFSGTLNQFMSTGTNIAYSNLEVGDVDGDGDLDVVLANGNGYVLLNDGQGGLSAGAGFPTTYNVYRIALRDVDADGDLDVLALGFSSIGGQPSQVKVCRNTGNGTFTDADFAVASNNGEMVVDDVDADGDQDIIIVGSFTSRSELWLNNGQGVFARLMELSLDYAGATPLLGDLDNDGDLDLLSAFYSVMSLSVRLNGAPPAPAITGFSPASGPEGTTVTINGSGFLGTTAVRFNGTAAPGFVVNSPIQLTVRVPMGATTGLISVANAVATTPSATPFTVVPLVSATGLAPGRNAVAAARNASVNLTLATPVTAATAGNMRVFGSLLRGRRPGVLSGGGTTALSFDPDQDFAPGEQVSVSLPGTMLTAGGGQVRRQVYQFTAATSGPGGGAFRVGTDVPVGRFSFTLATGDLDNDGDLDLLTSTETSGGSASIGVQLNDGLARFRPGATLDPNLGGTISCLALGDVDADGDLDVVTSLSYTGLSVFLNNGNASFGPALYLNISAGRFALGDMDADGDLDLVTSAYQGGVVGVALNDGTGRFVPQPLATATASTPLNVALGDVDADGDLDVLTSNDTNGARLFLNDGNGLLGTGTVLAVPGATRCVALGDVDADGDLDLAVVYNDAGSNGWLATFANNGTGAFALTTQRANTGRYVSQVLFGDVDHDGDLDLVVSNASSNDVSIRLNNGLGGFAGTPSVPVHANPTQLVLGDLDGDGDLDFAVSQATSGSTFVDIRLNDGQALATAPAGPDAAPVAVYPNPAHGSFAVAVPMGLRPASGVPLGPLRLYNAVGQLVLEQPLVLSANGEMTVSVAHLPGGVYTLRLHFGHALASYKLVVY